MLSTRVPSIARRHFLSRATGLYNLTAFIAHAAWLRQTFVHCARFPTAASHRSLDRVSVPVWLIILSDQLPIVGLVGRYLTNYLMGRGPLPGRPKPLTSISKEIVVSCGISTRFRMLSPTQG